jgi:hypothetical protein
VKTQLLIIVALCIISCKARPKGPFVEEAIPRAPNYALDSCWAALPWTQDQADLLPDSSLSDNQATAAVDVFFIHPTTWTYKAGRTNWNGPVYDPEFNKANDESPIKYQASIFNGVGRVFAPRYRQAHLHSYYAIEKKPEAPMQAFKLAYKDVATAFAHYLMNHNQGRPIILAAHSQGSTHGIMLLKQFFDEKPLQKQLVAAYLVGMPVEADTFNTIPPCSTATQTGCFCSWRTVKRGKTIKWESSRKVTVTNPLNWSIDNSYAPARLNRGAVLRPFEKIIPNATDAQVTKDGFLWAEKPRFPFSWLWMTKNFHIADYNFYYLNVRENAAKRASTFLQIKN